MVETQLLDALIKLADVALMLLICVGAVVGFALWLFFHLKGSDAARGSGPKWRPARLKAPKAPARRPLFPPRTGILHRGVISLARGTQAPTRMAHYLEMLRRRDPDFDLDRFTARVTDAFRRTHRARRKKDWAKVRTFVSDGMLEGLTLCEELRRAKGVRRSWSLDSVETARVVQVDSDRNFDAVHVHFGARALGEKGSRLRLEEVWTFLRRPGARTLKKPGLIEGACPNCGAAISMHDVGLCGSCRSLIRSGEYDWVLCKVSQRKAWRPRCTHESLRKLSLFAEADPGMHVLVVEDRACVAFWEWQRALWERDPHPLKKISTEGFRRHFQGALRLLKRRFMDVSIDWIEAEEFKSEAGWDVIRARVDWCGRSGQGSGKTASSFVPVQRSDYFHMARRTGIRTDRKLGLCSRRCWSCGAPYTRRTGYKCEYCGEVLNDGGHDWILANVTPGRGRVRTHRPR